MMWSKHRARILALVGWGALSVGSAVSGCATNGMQEGGRGIKVEPGVDESAVDEATEAVEDTAPVRPVTPDFAPEDVQAQMLAEATCTALKGEGGWSFAVRRDCSGFAADCSALCANLTEAQAGTLRCFNSLHIYADQPHSTPATLGLKTYRYNSCGGGCGPNYCCCGN